MTRQVMAVCMISVLAGAAGPVGCGPSTGAGNDNVDAYVCGEPCDTEGALRCSGDVLEICSTDAQDCRAWQVQQDCAVTGLLCDNSGGQPSCVPPETCNDQLQNQDETDVDCGGVVCPACVIGQGCSVDEDCETDVCIAGECYLCRAGTHGCFGNWLRICATDNSSWLDVEHCDAIGGYVCNALSGACELVQPIGNGPNDPTGTYYQFAHFTASNSPFLGGADVDSLEDRIYVNRDGAHVDVYTVELLDSDNDGVAERNQHPDNPDNTGPIEERVLTLVETYDIPIGATHNNELYITADSIVFTRGIAAPGDLFEYDIGGGTVATIVDVSAGLWSQLLGYDDVNDLWFTAIPYERWVFSYDPIEGEWVLEFAYPDLAGDHSDGLEVVTDPNTGLPYVYVSDMTSDFIAQYTKDATGQWVQENLFQYHQPGADHVEGMGFGALNHFWITNEGYGSGIHVLYEIGGGDMDQYIVP